MPAGRFRSRTFRRDKTRLPGSRTVLHYKLRKPKNAHCARCKDVLKAVPRLRPKKMQKVAKTKKRPQRMFGGVLCSRCARREIISKARSK